MSASTGGGRLELRAGLLEHGRARWARGARLRAEPGTLVVVRGWRRREIDVSGARLQRAQPAAADHTRRLVAVVHYERGALAAFDLADWLPVEPLDLADMLRRDDHLDRLDDRLDDAAERVARALGVPWRPRARRVQVTDRITPEDPLLSRGHVAVLLGLAVVLAAGWVLGLSWAAPGPLVAAGVAAVPLVGLGLSPVRWWLRTPAEPPGWRYLRTPAAAGWVGLEGPASWFPTPTADDRDAPSPRVGSPAESSGGALFLAVVLALAAWRSASVSLTATAFFALAAALALLMAWATRDARP